MDTLENNTQPHIYDRTCSTISNDSGSPLFLYDFYWFYLIPFTEEYGDREVKQRLREAFDSVSKGFVEDLIDEPLMEKMNLETQLPEVFNGYWILENATCFSI